MDESEEYQWQVYGHPIYEGCQTTYLPSVTAFAWDGNFTDDFVCDSFTFTVGKPDPRNEGHTILGLRRVIHPGSAGTEIQISIDGTPTTNNWEYHRPLAYDSKADLLEAHRQESPSIPTPIFKYQDN
jgi:hypothetical protein